MTRKIFILPICCIFLVLVFCSSCRERHSGADKYASLLMTVYQRLGYTKLGKDYPSHDLFEIWKQNNFESRTYQQVQSAKKELQAKIANDPERILNFTLDAIGRQCNQDIDQMIKEDQTAVIDVELECVGAITALYFFEKPDQDKMILDRLPNSSPRVLNWLTEFRFEWIYNRPNPQRWIEAIENIPNIQIDWDRKATFIQNLKEAGHSTEKFGVMLGDSGTAH